MADVTAPSFDVGELDRAYHSIMRTMIDTTQAPHFTDLAAALDVSPDRALQLMQELVAVTPGWMHPGTDYLASFPPFNVQPTQYHINVDDRHGWFGQ